ncbi:MAG: ATP synthase F1 subunit delta, partial [Planctomycetota bacterium]
SGLAANFVKLMAKNRRLFALRDTIEAFKALLAERRGEISATVTSAQPLSEAQLGEVRDMLSASAGRNVQLETAVDPSLLGGLIVKMGSRMIDNSLRTKLNSLRTVMKEAG